MWRFKAKYAMTAALLLVTLGQRARAATDPVAASVPPPGELVLKFANDIPPAFDRVHLHFFGDVTSNGFSGQTRITWRFDWLLPSGEVAYSPPVSYALFPGFTTHVDSAWTAGGCPTQVSLDFTTDSPLGATVNGTFDHTCTIPEPGLLTSAGTLLMLAARRFRKKVPCGN